jgi:hypothetical protein
MIAYGVKIVKRIGEAPIAPGPEATAFGLSHPDDAGPALKGIEALGFHQFLIMEDTDGNLIKVQQQI